MNIRIVGDKALEQVAAPIKKITKEIVGLSSEMVTILRKSSGVGLAATQLGISRKLIVIDYSPNSKNTFPSMTEGEAFIIPQMPVALVNPEILSYSDSKVTYEEGCLSVPRVYADVIRSAKVVVKAKFLDGNEICMECGGLLSVIFQHEIDHLNGILFIDRLNPDQLERIKPKINKLKSKNT